MPTALRPVAIHVEEPTTGDFSWVLMEVEDGGTWAEIRRSELAAKTYHRAMADGLLALQALIDDLDIGPRRPLKRTKAARADQQPPQAASHTDRPEAEPPAPPRPSLFGFGPAT